MDAKKLMGLGGIAKDIQAAVTGAARSFGLVDDVPTLGEIYSMSNKLTDYVVQTKDSVNPYKPGTEQTNRMVVGPQSPAFGRQAAAGQAFTDVDNRNKAIVSDKDSKLIMGAFANGKPLMRGQPVALRDIIDNPNVTEGYPELLDTPVILNTSMENGAGWETKPDGTNVLNLGPGLVDRAQSDPSDLHDIILHEIQHGIQEREDFARGGNPADQRTPEDQALVKDHNRIVREHNRLAALLGTNQIEDLDLDLEVKSDIKNAYESYRAKAISPTEFATDVAEAINSDPESSRYARSVAREIMEVFPKMGSSEQALNAMSERNTADYMNLHGEEEARFTQNNRRKSQEELDALDKSKLYPKGTKVTGQSRPTLRMIKPLNSSTRFALEGKMGKSWKFIKAQGSAFGSLGRKAGTIAEEAVGEAAYIDDLGLQAGGHLQADLRVAAKAAVAAGKFSGLKEAMDSLNKKLSRKLEAIENIPTEQGRQAALAGVVRENPEFRAMIDAYQLINDNTRLLVKQMIASAKGKLTEADVKKIKTLVENQTRYLTRTYALFQGKSGDKWRDKLINEYRAAEAALASGKAIPEKYQDSFRRYKDGLNYIRDNEVAVFDQEDLEERTIEQLRVLYDIWLDPKTRVANEEKAAKGIKDAGERTAAKREMLTAAIMERGEQVDGKEIERRAQDILSSLIGDKDSGNPVASYYRGFKQDKSILMERKHAPKEIRELMGEITDPSVRVMTTVFRQGELIARTNMLLKLREELYGEAIVSNEDHGTADPKFTEQLKGDNWGPLEGYWVTPDIAAVMNDQREIATNMEDAFGKAVIDPGSVGSKIGGTAIKTLGKLAGLQKLYAIVWNPMQIVWNFVGSPIMGVANGNVNPKTYIRAADTSARLFAKELKNAGNIGRPTQNTDDMQDVIKYDILDSAQIGELRSLPQKHIQDLIKNRGRFMTNLIDAKDVGGAFIKQAFMLSDLNVKMANFFQRQDAIREFYKLNGDKKTDEQIKREAASDAKDTNITFRRAAPIVKIAERSGFTYVLPYIQGVFRSIAYNEIVGYKDVLRGLQANTPEARNFMLRQGLQRLVGVNTALFGLTALAGTLMGGDEDKDAKIRRLLMPDARYGQSVYIGDDEKGNALMLRMSRFDPLGPATDLMRIVYGNATPKQKFDDVVKHMKELVIKPRLSVNLLGAGLELVTPETAVKEKQTKLERLMPETTNIYKKLVNAVPGLDFADAEQSVAVFDTMLPGVTNIIDPNNRKPVESKGGAPFDQVAGLMVNFGGKLDVVNTGAAAAMASQELKDARTLARKQFFDQAKITGDPTRDNLISMLSGMDGERKAFIRLKEVYEGLEAMDMSRSKIDEALKKAKVSEHDRHLLYSGKYDTSLEGWRTKGSSVLSKKSIKQRLSSSAEFSPDADTEEREEKALKEAVRVARELGYKVKE